jgi:hypothetical protein
MKMGVGALIMTTSGRASTADITAAKAAMEDLSVSRVGVVPGDAVKSLEFIGASGSSIDFSAYIDAFLGQIAAGTGYPKDVLLGSNAGSISGSEVPSRALYALIQGDQTKMEPYIRDVVRKMGHEGNEYKIKWPVRSATDERAEAEIRVLHATADEAEQRVENMKATEGRNPGDIQIGFKEREQTKAKDPDKKQNMAGVQ